MSDNPAVNEKDKPFILALIATGITILTILLAVIPQTSPYMQPYFDKIFTFDTTITSMTFSWYAVNKIVATRNQAQQKQ